MQASSYLIATVIVIGFSIALFSLWLSLKIFGLKAGRGGMVKIVGIQAIYMLLVSAISALVSGSIEIWLNILSIIGGVLLWITLLKYFASSWYKPSKAIGAYLLSYAVALVLSIMAAVLGIVFFAQVFKIDGNSMAPSLQANQTVLVYKFDKQPDTNSIVVYKKNSDTMALGRVRGTPGQSVAIPQGKVEINGELKNTTSVVLAENQYYVTTDNASYNIPPRIINSDSIVGTVGPKL